MSPIQSKKTNHKSISGHHSTKATLDVAAREAVDAIQKMESSLPIDDVNQAESKAARVANRVSAPMVALAASIVAKDPERFPDFDAAMLEASLTYEQAMSPLATAATSLGKRISQSVRKRRGDAAAQTLALYQTLKGVGRLTARGPTNVPLQEMEKLIRTTRKSRAETPTKAEIAKKERQLRIEKKAGVVQSEIAEMQGELDQLVKQGAPSTTTSVPDSPTKPAVSTTAN